MTALFLAYLQSASFIHQAKKPVFFKPKFGRKVLQVAALALNIFEHILSSIDV